MKANGKFEVKMNAEPPYDVADGVALGRASFDKRFTGPLEATSQVQMLSARTPVDGSGVYVALERIVGTLEGKAGSFVVHHTGLMKRGERSLSIHVVPDSGTGELKGLSGHIDIQIVDGQHYYDFDYAFEG
ncbi:MAG: DUF3224 domain-containing protein [Polyangiaceae bacterium]